MQMLFLIAVSKVTNKNDKKIFVQNNEKWQKKTLLKRRIKLEQTKLALSRSVENENISPDPESEMRFMAAPNYMP